MSDNITAITQRLREDPALRERVMSAASVDERREIIANAGLPMPSREEMQAWASLADVAGGSTPTNSTSYGPSP